MESEKVEANKNLTRVPLCVKGKLPTEKSRSERLSRLRRKRGKTSIVQGEKGPMENTCRDSVCSEALNGEKFSTPPARAPGARPSVLDPRFSFSFHST